jgi:hypothetical protein
MEKTKEEKQAIEKIVRRLKENILNTEVGLKQVVFHKEWYESNK